MYGIENIKYPKQDILEDKIHRYNNIPMKRLNIKRVIYLYRYR